jgi:bla regulator protein blaR1
MIIYILKFSACLALFLVFYKIFLEKENMHVFKRFYLLSALLFAISIPLVTFTYYIETTVEMIPNLSQINPIEYQTNYLPILLWSVYGLGAFIYGIKFIRNLYKINYKIKHNPTQKINRVTNVLLQDLISPHTFFNFIFFNKQKYESQQIPKEVLWHEETHAVQKHSIDILFIEVLQIVFWFNPLMYFIKHFVKLNHEFLADQAVLKKGVKTVRYQETLLAFSSNAAHPQLANAINYSLIKKRFTVMKTQTSKKRIWLRSFLLLPILAILLFSFSSKVIVSEEKNTKKSEQELISNQEKATKDQVKEYNALAKKYNDMSEDKMVIKKNDIERLKYLYNLMSVQQRKKAQPFPSFPAPPPAPDIPKAPKVIELKEVPPPPPLPKNATPEQKRKYKEGYKNAQVAAKALRLKSVKGESVKVRELRSIEKKEQRLRLEKLTYREAQVAKKALKLKAQKRELMRVGELSTVEDRKQLQEAKLVYRNAQIAARVEKIKAEKGELMRVRELKSKKERELKKKLYEDLKNKVKDQKKYSLEEINKMAKAEKKAYKKAQRKEKALKKKSKKKEN